jgi:glycosyltransferase involved in cell wall biosynthesis
MKPLISIIVPIFNSQDYLRKCIDSLLCQTLKEIEIILINDGSTDISPEIIDEYAKKDPRVKAIHKKNSGYGASMNRGIRAAKASYIGTIEADDYADRKMFETMYRAAERTKAQIVKTNYYRVAYGKKKTQEKYIVPPGASTQEDFDGKGVLIDPHKNSSIFWSRPSVWSAIYKKAFLKKNDIHFLETPHASFQDTGFQLKCFIAADKLYLLDKAFVHYRINNVKSTVKSEEKVFYMRGEIESAKLFLRKYPHKEAKLLQVITGASFNIYKWNLRWLGDDLVEGFLISMRNDFKRAKADGLINKKYFSNTNMRLMHLLLMAPRVFYWYVANLVHAMHKEKQLKNRK